VGARPRWVDADEIDSVRIVVPRRRPIGTIALRGGRVITMRGDTVLGNGTVVVRRNRIVAVGPTSVVPIPQDAVVLDMEGKTIMPGFIDLHAHFGFSREESLPRNDWRYQTTLAYGVTTARDPSGTISELGD